MDGFKEKKWFVYLVDHHEGPFSMEDFQGKLVQGQLSGTSYIWADGMADWKMMTEVEVFNSILRAGADRSIPALTMPTLIRDEPLQNLAAERAGGMVIQTDPSVYKEPPPDQVQHASAMIVASSLQVEELSSSNLNSVQLVNPAYNGGPDPFRYREFSETNLRRPRVWLKQILKWFLILAFIAGVSTAYVGGYLGPVLNSQALRSSTQTLSNIADPVLMFVTEKVPLLNIWISPIPQLQDVDKDEFEALKAAARVNLDAAGPRVALALSRNDLINPTFYASSNLPDGAVFDIYVEGIAETLLNQLAFSAKSQVVISKRLGETSALKGLDGKIFPRGQYTVMVVDPGTQPSDVQNYMARFIAISPEALPRSLPKGLKVVGLKSYFLGGAKDGNYTSRLKEFHDKLGEKAKNEMNECKQFAATLDMQLASTKQKFAFLHRSSKFTPAQAKAWGAFNRTWTALSNQLNDAFGKISADSLKNDYFYGNLYLATQQASQAVNKLHEIQNGVYASTADPKSAEIQIGEASAIAQAAVNELKTKIDFVDKLPPKPNGMPNRDGL